MNVHLRKFLEESNRIEGIERAVTYAELDTAENFLGLRCVLVKDMRALVDAIEPGEILRDQKGLDCRVGRHFPPPGGPAIPLQLGDILRRANNGQGSYQIHADYELLHPFTDGNGRSGRLLWLWCMKGEAPLGFLHHWYIQSLEAAGKEPK